MSHDKHWREKGLPEPTSGVGGILPRLLRTIWQDLNYNYPSLRHRIRVYCTKMRHSQPDSGTTNYPSAAAIERDFYARTMTIKGFINNLRVLDIPRIELQITLFHVHRMPTVHSLTVNLREVNADDLAQENQEPPVNEPSELPPPWEV